MISRHLHHQQPTSSESQVSSPAQPTKWTVAGLRRYLGLTEQVAVPELQLEPELASYDALLSGEVNHVG